MRLLLLFCFWSLAYALLSRLASGSFGSLYDFVYSFVQGHYHLWFLTAMVLCCLFLRRPTPPSTGAACPQAICSSSFSAWSILFANFNLTPDTAPILYRITLNFSFDYLPYLGYAVWGCWLSRREFKKAWLLIAPAVFLAVTVLTTWGNIWYSHYKQVADGWLFSYFSLPSLIRPP